MCESRGAPDSPRLFLLLLLFTQVIHSPCRATPEAMKMEPPPRLFSHQRLATTSMMPPGGVRYIDRRLTHPCADKENFANLPCRIVHRTPFESREDGS
jgi:hypothetical protein